MLSQSSLAIVDWFIPVDIHDGEAQLQTRARILVALGGILFLLAATYAVILRWMGSPICCAMLITAAGGVLVALLTLRWTSSCSVANNLITAIFLATLTALALRLGGYGAPSLWWYAAVPVVSLRTTGRLTAIFWFAATIVSLCTFYLLDFLGYAIPNDVSLQHYKLLGVLSVVGLMTLMLCTTLLHEAARDRTQQLRLEADEISEQLANFERLITEISTGLVRLSADEVDAGIERALASVGDFTRADRAYVFLLRNHGSIVDNTHEWCAPGIEPQIEHLQDIWLADDLPWFAERIGNGEVFHVANLADLPPEGECERAHFLAQGIQSLIVVPMIMRGRLVGFLGFDSVRASRTWSDSEQVLLRLIGETFVNAIERKRAEGALRETEELFRRFTTASGHGIAMAGLDGKLMFANPAALQLVEEPSEEALCRNTFYQYLLPEDAVRLNQEILPVVLESGEWTGELPVISAKGKRIPSEQNIFLIRDEKGAPRMLGNVITDITKRKRAEMELEQARYDAEAANRAKSEFLANMSHEIRTPMTAILGFTDILLGTASDQEQFETAAIIKRNGEYLVEIINDILDLSKIEAGKLDFEFVRCSPHEIILDVVSLMQVRANAKSLPLRLAFDGPLPPSIRTDPTRLRQILINVVGNAIKFTELGEVRLVTRLLDAHSDEPKMQFEVTDSGIGIAVDQLAGLFEPFSQGDASTTRTCGGTGLGLTISKRLAEKLGGDIVVQSAAGEGSRFQVTIATGPIDKDSLIDTPCDVRRASPKKDTQKLSSVALDCRVLLAEDGIDNQRLIAFVLKKAGADVVVADNGKIALDLVRASVDEGKPFDVVLMDMQMPVMDGYEATRRLRQAGCDLPIIAVTAHAMRRDRDKCLQVGCDEYITKPIDSRALIQRIADYASRREPIANSQLPS